MRCDIRQINRLISWLDVTPWGDSLSSGSINVKCFGSVSFCFAPLLCSCVTGTMIRQTNDRQQQSSVRVDSFFLKVPFGAVSVCRFVCRYVSVLLYILIYILVIIMFQLCTYVDMKVSVSLCLCYAKYTSEYLCVWSWCCCCCCSK